MTQNLDTNNTDSNQFQADRKAMHRPHEARGQRTPFTPLQVAEIRAYLARKGAARDRALLEVALDTMLRASDLLSLTVGDVQDAFGAIRTTIPLAQRKVSGKRCRAVVITLSPRAQAAIAELIEVEGKVRGDALFTRPGCPHGRPLTREQFARIVKGWAALLGCDPSTYAAHSTRRTRAAHIYRETKDIAAIQHLLGHASLGTTTSYLGVDVHEALSVSRKYFI
jgi:integrase